MHLYQTLQTINKCLLFKKIERAGIDNEEIKRISKDLLANMITEHLLYFRLNLSWLIFFFFFCKNTKLFDFKINILIRNSIKDDGLEILFGSLSKAKNLKDLSLNFSGGG